MDKIISQLRRNFYDDGRNDVDFTSQEAKLKVARDNVAKATQELLRASERLNQAALAAGVETTMLN